MTTKAKVLDISMNLNRVGNWAADDYIGKKNRIKTFLVSTSNYLGELENVQFPSSLADTVSAFRKEYKILEKEGNYGPKDPLAWAEQMMTWGNILTHRSKLLDI